MVVGCAADPIQLPDFDVAARQTDKEVTYPAKFPTLCELPETGTWDPDCWQTFSVFEELAVDTHDIAVLNAGIAADSDEAYDEILQAAKRQQDVALIREDMLQKERNDHFWDNVWHRAGILLLLGIGVTQ